MKLMEFYIDSTGKKNDPLELWMRLQEETSGELIDVLRHINLLAGKPERKPDDEIELSQAIYRIGNAGKAVFGEGESEARTLYAYYLEVCNFVSWFVKKD